MQKRQKMTRWTIILLIATVFALTVSSFGQTANQNINIQNVKIGKSGQIKWTTTNEKANTKFSIEEFRWNKWEVIGRLNGKGIGDNSYTFLADTSCGLYQIRICATELEKNNYYSKTIPYPIQKEVKMVGCGINQNFSTKTRFEICDSTGKILLSGCSNVIEMKTLSRGVYYMYYANSIAEFIKK